MSRALSHSEIAAVMDCQRKHAFAYTGHLTGGDALKPRATRPVMRDGRAWGAGVAVWHAIGDLTSALQSIGASLDDDAEQMRAAGVYDQVAHADALQLLTAALGHYAATATRLPLIGREVHFDVAIPSRTGRGRSNRYRLVGYLDGLYRDDDGRLWIVEFKWRGRLTALEVAVLDQQVRRYAWAFEAQHGERVAGVILDERLQAAPKAPRVLKSGAVSHAKDQLCTHEAYARACYAAGDVPKGEVLEALRSRRWQERHTILFRPAEVEEAGRQLVSAAQQIRDLDSGALYPVANPQQQRCTGCLFRSICPDPGDGAVVEAWFRRVPPKRMREREEVAA